MNANGHRLRLSPVRERRLVCAAREDPKAREKLVDAYMPLIGSVAWGYRNTSVERQELIQEGVVGLLRALGRFDVERGVPFWAYASWWVRQAMQQLVAEMTRPVVLSDRALRLLARVKDARSEHGRLHGGDPSGTELAVATGIPRDQVVCLLAAEQAPRGMEERLVTEHGMSMTIGERVADPTAQDEYERVVDGVGAELVRALCENLDEREHAIVFARCGFDRPVSTLREIADGLDLSVERVRQIEERALEKLRDALEEPAQRPRSSACPVNGGMSSTPH